MVVRKISDPSRPDASVLAEAVAVLRKGGLIILPTDTVYGLGTLPEYVGHLFAAKKRPVNKQIAWLIADIQHVPVILSPLAQRLAAAFWPGPLTLVLPHGDGAIGLRIPDHPVALSLLRALGGPLAVTSANVSGEQPACSAINAHRAVGSFADFILDAGPTRGDTASTVIRLHNDQIELLRTGTIHLAQIHSVISD